MAIDDEGLAVIDSSVFKEIQEILEDEFPELLIEYKEDAERYLGELLIAANNNKLQEINEVAHAFGSASGHMGFMRLHSLLKSIELLAKKGDIADYVGKVRLIRASHEEVVQMLEHSDGVL